MVETSGPKMTLAAANSQAASSSPEMTENVLWLLAGSPARRFFWNRASCLGVTSPVARAFRSPPVAPTKTSVGWGIPCCWVASLISEQIAVARDLALRASSVPGSSGSSVLGGVK